MNSSYQKTAQVGILKACLRYIEDPNRNIIGRLFLAITPLLFVWILSPLDLLPEFILGPLGLTDDILLLIGMFLLARLAYSFYGQKRYVKPNKQIKDHN
jgi:uncharacterized membrane protein YkvA (DUF1232 family)